MYILTTGKTSSFGTEKHDSYWYSILVAEVYVRACMVAILNSRHAVRIT